MLSTYQRVVIISLLTTFSTGYSQTYIYTYLPEMTLWMGYTEQDKAFYASAAMLSFFSGVFLTNYPFALLSDKRGHRNVITGLMVVSAVVNLGITFSRDMTSLLVLRFFAGSSFTIIALSRAMIAVWCNDHQKAQGMSINMTGYLTGITVGSVLGGYLVSFSVKYPKLFGHSVMFSSFPYILPPMIAMFFAIIAAIGAFCLYPKHTTECVKPPEETDPILKIPNQTITEISSSQTLEERRSLLPNLRGNHNHYSANCQRHISDIDVNKNTLIVSYDKIGVLKTKQESNNDHTRTSFSSNIRQSTLLKLLRDKNVMKTVISYGLLTSSMNLYVELFPVWASLPKYLGGISYASNDIGTVLAVITITGSIAQLLMYPVIERRYGSIKAFVGFALAMMVALTLTPVTRRVSLSMAQWVCVVAVQFIVRLSEGAACSAAFIVLNNSVMTSQAGAVNGLAMLANSLGTIITSQVGGEMFTWSITSRVGTPVDVSLMFVYMGVHCTLAAAIVYTQPRCLNRQAAR